MTIPETEPAIITQGVTHKWRKRLADYPASEWTLNYAFRGAGAGVNLTGVADGDSRIITMSAAQSAALTVGRYDWQARMTNGTDIYQVAEGVSDVAKGLAALSSGTDYDGRTQLEQDLDAVRGALRAKISGGAVAEYTIGTRSLRNYGIEELITLESRLLKLVAREKQGGKLRAGGPFFKVLETRFRRE